jgi:26S proteasome regulatory subunit N1
MAQDGETVKPVDKGKGKATDGELSKAEDTKKDKDGKPLVNGKKDEGTIGGRQIVQHSTKFAANNLYSP